MATDPALPPAGTRIHNRFNGETFIFTHVDDSPDIFRCDVFLERGGVTTGTGRQHFHPNADETFLVRQGALRVMLDGAWHSLGPGESLMAPRGTPHLFRNGHDGETLFTATFSPACDHLRFFLNMARSTERHPDWYDEKGEPPLALRALFLHAYAGHAYGDGIPVWLQRAVFAALTPVALARGYRLSVRPRRGLHRGRDPL